jgi:hypothetical protein
MESAQRPAPDDRGQSSSTQAPNASSPALRPDSAPQSGTQARAPSDATQLAGPSHQPQNAPAPPTAAGATTQSAPSSAAASAAAPGPASQPNGVQPPAADSTKASASAAPSAAAGTGAAAASTAAPGAAPLPPSPTDERLTAAQKRIARLEQQLNLEVQRRKDVEGEMKRLLQETSAGPFERADDVVEKHLREELDRARKEVTQLRATLATERREHAEIERAYAALQAQLQTAAPAAPAGPPNEEIEALKERQRRVLASIQQDLEASKQREADLRQSVEQLQGSGAASLSESMTNLRSENSALQMRLDEEHQRNRELIAKLQLATRVTDLIFRMRQNGATEAVAVALPAAAR